MSWWITALLAAVLYGVWGFLCKVTASQLGTHGAFFYQAAGGMLVAGLFLNSSDKASYEAIGTALFVGAIGQAATLLFLLALSQNGPVSIVNLIISLSPLVTIVLAMLFLNESITLIQGWGMLLGLIAIVLLCR